MDDCRVHLLPDDPSREDLFGPHQRIADAIADLVRQETGKKAIALEGTWGSGKSTVVRLLRRTLDGGSGEEEPASATVFSFDAWAHRGDPLRRSFIEELADHLISIEWIEHEDWKEDLAELREQRETLDITSSPRLKGVGKLMVILLLLMPLGYVQLTVDNPLFDSRLLGAALALAPALLGLAMWIGWAIKRFVRKRDKSRSRPYPPREENIESDVLALFLNKVQTVEESTKLRTPDPTSIEFRRLFTRLLDDALEDESRRLVLAIDNLDRIEADEALTIWSTMRTFFEFGIDPSRGWLERFWLLVPYDRGSLHKIWKDELPGREASNGENTQDERREAPKNVRHPTARTAAEAFIDKSFQIRFRVSPPVLSDWRRFFDRQFKEAFPDHESDRERYAIAQVYRRSRQPNDANITPRNIILFLNQVGALHRQWSHDEVSLEEQSLFVAFKDRITDRKSLVSASFVPSELHAYQDRDELGRKMAALEYGVKPDKALQVIMGEPIELALTEGKYSDLEEFRGAPGLSEVFFHTVQRNVADWRRANPNALSHTAMALSELDDELPPTMRDSLWRTIRRELPGVKKWPSFYTESANGLLQILHRAPKENTEELQLHLLDVISASCPRSEEDADREHIEDWIGGSVALLEGLATGRSDGDAPQLRVPGDPGEFLRVVRVLRRIQSDPDVRYQFLPEASTDDVRKELEREVQEGNLDEETYKDVRFLAGLGQEWDWDSLGSTVANTLRANNNIDVALIGSLVPLLEELVRLKSVPGKHLSQQTEGGHIFHRLHQANQADDTFAKATCIHSLLMHNPGGNRTANVGNASSGQSFFSQVRDNPDAHSELIEKVSDLVVEFGYVRKLFEQDEIAEQAPKLCRALLRHLLQQSEALEQLELTDFVSAVYPKIQDALPSAEDRERVWRTLVERRNLFRQLIQIPVGADTAELHSEVYEATLGLVGSEEYEDYLRRRLGALAEETWQPQLASDGPLLRILRRLVERNAVVKVPVDFADALKAHFRKVVRGQIEPHESERWSELLEVLEASHRRVLVNDLISILNFEEKGHKHRGLQLYGEVLLDDETALRGEADSVLTTLVPDLLEEQDAGGLRWVEHLLDKRWDVIEEASDSARETLKDKIRRQSSKIEPDSKTIQTVVRIAEALDVELPEPGEPQSEDSSETTSPN